MYQLTGKWTILPGKEKKAKAELKKMALAVQKNEPGTLLYLVFTPDYKEKSLPMPPKGEVIFFEIYKNKAAFTKHIAGSIFTNFVKKYGRLFLNDFSDPPQLYITAEIMAKLGGFIRGSLK